VWRTNQRGEWLKKTEWGISTTTKNVKSSGDNPKTLRRKKITWRCAVNNRMFGGERVALHMKIEQQVMHEGGEGGVHTHSTDKRGTENV